MSITKPLIHLVFVVQDEGGVGVTMLGIECWLELDINVLVFLFCNMRVIW